MTTKSKVIGGGIAVLCLGLWGQRQEQPALTLTQVLGRPSGHSITVGVLSPDALQAYVA